MGDPPSKWEKADVILKAIASVALPLMLYVVGYQVTQEQQEIAHDDRMLERVTELMKPLASDSARERKLAAEVAGFLAEAKQLPPELLPVLIQASKDDPSPSAARAFSTAVAQAQQASPEIAGKVADAYKSIRARIYFQVPLKEQREDAQKLGARLSEALGPGFFVPGVEWKRGPEVTELRYFKREDKNEADRIAAELGKLGVNAKVTDLSPSYQSSDEIRPRHFELWLGNDYKGTS